MEVQADDMLCYAMLCYAMQDAGRCRWYQCSVRMQMQMQMQMQVQMQTTELLESFHSLHYPPSKDRNPCPHLHPKSAYYAKIAPLSRLTAQICQARS